MTKTERRTVRLLLVDPSPGSRERLRQLFEGLPDIDVVAEAGTVERAVRLVEEASPTEVLIDCELPKPGSFAAVTEMMALYPVPVVMLTKGERTEALEARALEAGAVALVEWKPASQRTPWEAEDLIRTVRAMSEVKVVRRRGQRGRPRAAEPGEEPHQHPATEAGANRIEVIAIGASTGGPPVLQRILRAVPSPLPVPVLLVQHLSPGFHSSLVKWLAESTGVPVVAGEHGMPLTAGSVYLAPDDRHMSLDASGRLVLTDDPPENGSRPSVSVLFRSVALRCGPHAIGILLTGMGRDGAKELRLMRDRGAVTIAQDEETSVVHGMPGEAIKLKGARYVLAPDRIASVVQHHLIAWSPPQREQANCR